MAASQHDATLVVQLLTFGSQIGLDDAIKELTADGFDPLTADASDAAVQPVLTFGETVATLVKHSVLDRALVADLWWIEGMWNRVAPAAQRLRDRLGEAKLYENFEALAEAVS